MYRETKIRFLIVNNASEKVTEQKFESTERKNLSTRDSILGKNIFQKGRPDKDISVIQKLKEFIISRPTLQEMERR